MMNKDENSIIERCLDFLRRSSQKYHSEIARQVRDLEAFGGNMWTDSLKKDYHRTSTKKLCMHWSDWTVLANAIASPYSESPWHTQLINREGANEEVQNKINIIESDTDYKSQSNFAVLRQIVCGAGFVVVTTDIDYITKEPVVVIEFVNRQDSVALDPDIMTVDGSDAEAGAIVNYMSLSKAKRLYGSDIVPFNYPNAAPKMDFGNIHQWLNEAGKIQVVHYYEKNEDGSVSFYKIIGDKVIEAIDLPIKYIPIIRFAGYQEYSTDGLKYSGIVSKTWELQCGLDIAYSTLMERANRSIKANLIASTDAVEGLDQYYKKMSDEDGLLILHNKGTERPTPVVEQFQTGDLREVIAQTRELIADCIGVPLSGINGLNEKTATEIMTQKLSEKSNVSNFYNNAYIAQRTIARIIIELLNGGADVLFELESGPDVITNNMKRRQELSSIANMLPPDLQPILAIHMLDTVSSEFSEQIKSDVIANLGQNIKLAKTGEDPYAIHQIKQLQAMLDQTMQQLEEANVKLMEQEQDLKSLNLQMINSKEAQLMDMQKHNDEMFIKQQELQLKFAEAGQEQEIEYAKALNEQNLENVKLQKAMVELERERAKAVNDVTKRNGQNMEDYYGNAL